MNIAGIQADIAAKLAANTTLAPLLVGGQPLIYSHFTPDEDARALIAAAIRTNGICIEVGVVEASGDGTKPHPRATIVEARFAVFIAESPTVTHTPQEMALVSLVAAAAQTRTSAAQHGAKCTGYEATKSENGYVLHVLMFTMTAEL